MRLFLMFYPVCFVVLLFVVLIVPHFMPNTQLAMRLAGDGGASNKCCGGVRLMMLKEYDLPACIAGHAIHLA